MQKKGTYVKILGSQDYQRFHELELGASCKLYFTGASATKKKGFGPIDIRIYKKRKYRKKAETEGWYLLTNLVSKKLLNVTRHLWIYKQCLKIVKLAVTI